MDAEAVSMRSDAKYYEPDGEKGGYRYIGKYYRFRASGDALKLKKRALFLCAALALAAFLLAGFADAGETRAFYVGIPYVLALLPAGFCLASAYDILRAEETMTYPRYHRGPQRLILSARAGALLTLVSLAGCGVLKLRGGTVALAFPLDLALQLAAFGAVWAIYARDPACPVD
jgi:hypothetical protein